MPKIFVITGAASSGKTTTINYLRQLGYPVSRETARDILEEKTLAPRTIEFQTELAQRHLSREKEIRASNHDIIFTDRGLYDGIAYCKYFGLENIPEICKTNVRYDTIFFLEPLNDFEHDGLRVEANQKEALIIADLIRQEYQTRSMPCVNVPMDSVAKRAKFILDHLPAGRSARY
ncbi:MAG: ATP-binding protein [Candidatus Niyogibacteria bacterium]|nr:ATP-binding protein [Candidatus Niyogibacteria bacterium]